MYKKLYESTHREWEPAQCKILGCYVQANLGKTKQLALSFDCEEKIWCIITPSKIVLIMVEAYVYVYFDISKYTYELLDQYGTCRMILWNIVLLYMLDVCT